MATERFEAEYVAANRPVIIRGALAGAAAAPLDRSRLARALRRAPRDGPRRATARRARGHVGDVQRRIVPHRGGDPLRAPGRSRASAPDLLWRADAPRRVAARAPAADATAAGVGPAPFAACFGEPQATNPTIYLGAGRLGAMPMHFDPAENLLCVVEGGKDLTLFHPADTENVYPVGERNTKVIYSHVDFVSEGLDRSTFPKLAHALEGRTSRACGAATCSTCRAAGGTRCAAPRGATSPSTFGTVSARGSASATSADLIWRSVGRRSTPS